MGASEKGLMNMLEYLYNSNALCMYIKNETPFR